MTLCPKNNVQRREAQYLRNCAALIPQLSYKCGVVTHQNDTLTRQLRQKCRQGQNNSFHFQDVDVKTTLLRKPNTGSHQVQKMGPQPDRKASVCRSRGGGGT